MRGRNFLSKLHCRPFWPVLALAYVLLFQSILGNAAANTHALAMAQHDALGLGMHCLEGRHIGAADRGNTAPQNQAPAGDCLACKTACAAGVGMPVLPLPDAAALFVIYPSESIASKPHAKIIFRRPVLFQSDLASQAPPATLI